MQKREINAVIRKQLAVNGFWKDGDVWCRDTDDLHWRVDFESLPHWRRIEIGVGCTPRALVAGGPPARTNECLVVHDLHALPLRVPSPLGRDQEVSSAFSEVVRDALNTDSGVADEDRVIVIERAVDALATFLDGVRSEADLEHWIREGRADRRGFVHRTVKEYFGIPLSRD